MNAEINREPTVETCNHHEAGNFRVIGRDTDNMTLLISDHIISVRDANEKGKDTIRRLLEDRPLENTM